MLPLRACGLRFRLQTISRDTSRLALRHFCNASSRKPLTQKLHTDLSRASCFKRSLTTGTVSDRFNKLLSSFDHITVYRAGTFRTATVGFSRVATIFLFAFGLFAVAPRFYFDPTVSSLWIPAIILGGAAPMVITALATAPFVSNIRVVLPANARQSRENLLRFAQNMPPNTKMVVQTMRFLPWPMHREVRFNWLRRVPEASKQSANIEIQPPGASKARQRSEGEGLWYSWMVKRMYGRLHINRSMEKDLSAVPGVWNIMWEQIPLVGEENRVHRPSPPLLANREYERSDSSHPPMLPTVKKQQRKVRR